jgi:methylmalonyl-CoA/ethylmalonyl-CoA epimerase
MSESVLPLGLEGEYVVDHLGFAVESIDDQLPIYQNLLGGVFIEGGDTPGDFRAAVFRLPGGFSVELLEPVDRRGKLADYLEKHGTGLHHITLRCRDIETAMESATAAGYRVVGVDLENPPWREAYLHPKDTGGTLIQLFDSSEPADRRCRFGIAEVLNGEVTWNAGRYEWKESG